MTPGVAAIFSALPAVCLVASFFVYAYFAGGRKVDSDAAARGGKRMLGLYLRDYWYWLHAPAERALLRTGWSPDVISFFGLGLTFGAGLAFAAGLFGLAGWFIVLGGSFDILDGRIARVRGLSRPAGAFLDSSLDRYGDWALFSGLGVFYGAGPGLWAALLTLGGSFVISYARARAESLGIACSDGWLQRAERFFFLAAAGILTPVFAWLGITYGLPMLSVLAVLAVLSNVTAIMRVRSVYRNLLGAPRATP